MVFKKALKAIKSEISPKNIISIVILIVIAVFTLMQTDSFYIKKGFFNNDTIPSVSKNERIKYRENPETVSSIKDDSYRYSLKYATETKRHISGNDTILQKFETKDNLIKRVNIYFSNPNGARTKGKVEVNIADSKGKSICSSELKASLINNDSITKFDFTDDSESLNANRIVEKKFTIYKKEGIELKDNEEYSIKIKCKNVPAKDELAVYLCNNKADKAQACTINNKKTGHSLYCGVVFLHLNKAVFIIFIFGYLLGLFLILMPLDYLSEILSRRRKKETNLNKLLTRIMFVLAPFMAHFLTCKAFGFTTTKLLIKLVSISGILNIFILYFILLLFYLIFNRLKYATISLMLLAFVFSVTNFLLLQFRNSPLVATDFASFGTAMDVAANYTIVFSKDILWILTIGSVYICLAVSLKAYKSLELKKRGALLLVCVMLSGFGYWLLLSENAPTSRIRISGFDAKWSYKKYGSTLSFVLTIKASKIKKPEDYSVEKVKDITKNYQSDKAAAKGKVSAKKPNIIVIMNEAYSDLSYVGPFKTTGPYMPYFDSLTDNTIKGKLHTSVFGGNTANSEYEFLTGNTLAFMPMHMVAYNSKVPEGAPSIARTLTKNGYGGNISFHPGMKNSYNRDVVYPNLGFDKHISLEDLKNPGKVRAYVSDDYDFKKVISEYEKFRRKDADTPFWMFNVTIQNHSDFKYTSGLVDKKVVITDEAAKEEQAEQYLNLIKITDEALEKLVEYYRSQNEPTVIVMFGDHQPRVGDEFYRTLESRNKYGSNLERYSGRYQVPFMIWANYDIKEEKDVEISANYLGSYMLDKLHLPMTGYDKYLMDLYKKLPVVSAICYYDNKGNIYSLHDETKYSDTLNDYNCLQYNNVVDHKNRQNAFFKLK